MHTLSSRHVCTRRLYDRRTDPEESTDVYGSWREDLDLLAELEDAVGQVEALAAAGSDVCLE